MGKETEYLEVISKSTLYKLIEGGKWDEAIQFLKSHKVQDDHKLQAVHYRNKHGEFNTLARAVFLKAPDELIQMILEIGGPNMLKNRDKYGGTPFHSACALGSSNEIIKLFTDMSDLPILTSLNNKGHTPLDNLLSLGEEVVNKMYIIQEKIYALDPHAEFLSHKTWKNLLRWTHQLPQSAQDLALKGSLVRVVLNDKFVFIIKTLKSFPGSNYSMSWYN